LVIEDEKKVASFIKKGLESENFAVELSYNGKDGLAKAYDESFDVIILDLMLPELDGLTILQRLRNDKVTTPILILTAKGNIDDRVTGLNLGADDYLVKPFAFAELLARIRALLRRNKPQKNPVMKFNDLRINVITREVYLGKELIELSAREYSLLLFLINNAGRVLSRITIAEHVWNYDFDSGTNFIDVYINRLRNKIEKPGKKRFIHTVRGYGYMFKT
ncbi:DNA-binding response regulator, partial [candidate division KSB1 bacterium]